MTLRKAYLTIDDSPSARMDDMVDWLRAKNVPAIFFCRGDNLDKHFDKAVRAIEKGFVIANHSYSHPRSSQVMLDVMTGEIARTQTIIDRAYAQAGVKDYKKHFRFPHMDRGMGGWIVDYDQVPPAWRQDIVSMFADGLNITLTPPDQAARDKRDALQAWLAANGFVTPAFNGVSFPWYAGTEMAAAIDAMYTYSTSDWMLTQRHKGKWPWKDVPDLQRKIDQDRWLQDPSSAHIILAHDQEEIFDVTLALIDYCLARNIEFQPV